MDSASSSAAARVREAMNDAAKGLIEREVLVELIALAAVAGEHVLVIGPPGTAKSEAVRRTARALGGRYFEYLLGRFTEPGELFGPIDLRRLREGVVEVETRGMLPEAEIAFLDEVFLGSTAILNTLLGILNERRFRRGSTSVECPLRVCVGASNALPDDESIAAFADRFLVRVFLDPVPDARIEDLLAGGWLLARESRSEASATLHDVDTLARAARAMDLSGVQGPLAHALRKLRKSEIQVSDRRAVRAQRLIAAAAAMAGRAAPTEADLWPLIVAIPTREEQSTARENLRDLLARAENPALLAAAEGATAGPLARARRLQHDAEQLLRDGPPPGARAVVDGADPREAWALRIEGVLREIDAGFAAGRAPPELAAIRDRLREALGAA